MKHKVPDNISKSEGQDDIPGLGGQEDITGSGSQEDFSGSGGQDDISGLGDQEDIPDLGGQEDISGLGDQEDIPGMGGHEDISGSEAFYTSVNLAIAVTLIFLIVVTRRNVPKVWLLLLVLYLTDPSWPQTLYIMFQNRVV